MALSMENRRRVAGMAVGVGLGLPLALGIAGSAQAATHPHARTEHQAVAAAPKALTCSTEKALQAVARAEANANAVNGTISSEYSSNLSVLRRLYPEDTVAIKECQTAVTAFNQTNGTVASYNDRTDALIAGMISVGIVVLGVVIYRHD